MMDSGCEFAKDRGLGGRRAEFNPLRLDELLDGVTEQEEILTVVEAPFQFTQVGVQTLDAHVMEGSDHSRFEQAPEVSRTPAYGNSVCNSICVFPRIRT